MKSTYLLPFFLLLSFVSNAQPTSFPWQQVAPGVWKATVGKSEGMNQNNWHSPHSLNKLEGQAFIKITLGT